MATSITVAGLQTACAALADAILAEEWASAWKQHAVALTILLGLPQRSVKEKQGAVEYRERLDGLKGALKDAEVKADTTGSSGFVTTRVSL